MAQWVRSVIDGQVYNISQIISAGVVQVTENPAPNWFIGISTALSSSFPVKGPFATQGAAQAALDNQLPQLGGVI